MSTLDLDVSSDVMRVIRATFGSAAIEDVAALPGGRSGALVFSARIAGESYVIRVPSSLRDRHDERSNREITCMLLAAERGVGPDVRHADRATGITVSVKIDGILSGRDRALAPGRIERLASTVRKVHEGPRLPDGASLAGLMDYFDAALRERGAGGIPAALAAPLRDAADASRRFEKRAPCHNDLNPSNVLETAERTYLVDWETAGEGDPFIDLAQLGVFSLFAPGAREELLTAYLGRAPTAREHAHATLARVTALGFYAVSFIAAAVFGGEAAPHETMTPRPISEVVLELAHGKASARDVAVSLQHATLQEAASDAYRAARLEAYTGQASAALRP